jgi:hypothetical protein
MSPKEIVTPAKAGVQLEAALKIEAGFRRSPE